MEEWRTIVDNDAYEISSIGRVRRAATHTRSNIALIRKLQTTKGRLAYKFVILSRNCKYKSFQVHRLVAIAFHGPPPSPRHIVAHNNGNPTDNRVDNLRWATHAENTADRRLHGTHQDGEQNPNAKLTDIQVRLVRAKAAFGDTHAGIGRLFGVADVHVHALVIGKLRRGAGGYGIEEEV